EVVRPFLQLAVRLGGLMTGLADGALASIECQYLGRIAEADTRVLTLAALKGCLTAVVHEPVSFVNAPMIARQRRLALPETRSTRRCHRSCSSGSPARPAPSSPSSSSSPSRCGFSAVRIAGVMRQAT